MLSASKCFSEKSDFSRVTLTYPILKSKFLKSTKFATGRFLLAAAHIAKGSAEEVKHTSNTVGAGIIRIERPLKGENCHPYQTSLYSYSNPAACMRMYGSFTITRARAPTW